MPAHSGQFTGFAKQAALVFDEMCRVEREYKYLGLQYHCTAIQARDSSPDDDWALFREFLVRATDRSDLPWMMTSIQQLTDLLKNTSAIIDMEIYMTYRSVTRKLAICWKILASIDERLATLRECLDKLIEYDISGEFQDPNDRLEGELRHAEGHTREFWTKPQLERVQEMTIFQVAQFVPWMEEMKEIKIAEARGLVNGIKDMVHHFLSDGPVLEMPEGNVDEEVERAEEEDALYLEGESGEGADTEPGSAAERELRNRYGPGAAFQFA